VKNGENMQYLLLWWL